MTEKGQPTQLTTLELAKQYTGLGLSVIPLKPKDKRPNLGQWEQYQKRIPIDKELESWFSGNNNIAIVCGEVSNNLAVIDFDDRRAFFYCFPSWDELAQQTILVKTAKGIHVYIRAEKSIKQTTLRLKNEKDKNKPHLPVDIKAEGGYVVAPPSIHPDGPQYLFISQSRKIMVVDDAAWGRFNDNLRLRSEEWPFVERILISWVQGVRQNLAMGVAGFLRKTMNYDKDRAMRVMEGICAAANDDEISQRRGVVEATYSKEVDDIAVRNWLGDEFAQEIYDLAQGIKAYTRKGDVGRQRVEKAVKAKDKPFARDDFPTRISSELWKEIDGTKADDYTDIIATPFYYFKDGRIAKEIYDGHQPHFVIYDPSSDKLLFVNKFVGDFDELVLPLWDEALGPKLGVQLPSKPEDYGNAQTLFDDILKYTLNFYDPVDAEGLAQLKLCILYVMLSGFQDQNITYWPIVNHRGQSESGKGRLAKLMYLLADRGMWQVAPKIGSLHRAVNVWKPMLCLDEADMKDSSEAGEFIQFYNSRATGAVFYRYSTEIQSQQVSEVTGPTVMCTRKGFQDDGLESRCLVMFGKAGRNLGEKDGVPVLEPPVMFTQAFALRNKLLMFWLKSYNRYSIDYYGKVEGPVTARLQAAALELMGMAEQVGLKKVVLDTLTELSLRVVEQRAEMPDGKIVRTIHSLWVDPEKGAPISSKSEKFSTEQGYYGLRAYTPSEVGDLSVIDVGPADIGILGHKPFALSSRNDPNKPMSGISIGKYLGALNIRSDQVRVSTNLSKKIILLKPDDLEHLCRKYVPGYEPMRVLRQIETLEYFAEGGQNKLPIETSLKTDVSTVAGTCCATPPLVFPSALSSTPSTTGVDVSDAGRKGSGSLFTVLETPETKTENRGGVPQHVTETIETAETRQMPKEPELSLNTPASESPQISLDLNDGSEAQKQLNRLLQIFNKNLVDWALRRSIEHKLSGDPWGAFQLRQESRSVFPQLEHEPSLLADQYFSNLEIIANYIVAKRKGNIE